MKQTTVGETAIRSTPEQKRALLLLNRPAALGASWALQCLEGMRQSGRAVEGGWPGTLPEARGRIVSNLSQELRSLGLAQLDHDELVAATATAYEEAKRCWQVELKRPRRVLPKTEPRT
jgi:hypothetical protein